MPDGSLPELCPVYRDNIKKTTARALKVESLSERMPWLRAGPVPACCRDVTGAGSKAAQKMGSCLFALRALRVAALRGRLVAGLVAAVGRLVARVLILLIHAVSPPSG